MEADKNVSVTAIRLLVADDHEVIRIGLRTLASMETGWEVCGEATNGRHAVTLARQLRPHVVVMDIGLPELNGLEATRQIQSELPDCNVLIYSCHSSERVIRDALLAGARGFVLKTDPIQELIRAVVAVRAGAAFFTPRIERLVLDGYLRGEQQALTTVPRNGEAPRLSAREREVLQLLAEGKANKEVAAALGVSLKTAETHRANIMRKLDFHSLSDLVHYAIRNQLVEP